MTGKIYFNINNLNDMPDCSHLVICSPACYPVTLTFLSILPLKSNLLTKTGKKMLNFKPSFFCFNHFQSAKPSSHLSLLYETSVANLRQFIFTLNCFFED